MGDDVDSFVAVGDFGIDYLSTYGKDELEKVYKRFTTSHRIDKSMLKEFFIEPSSESVALNLNHNRL